MTQFRTLPPFGGDQRAVAEVLRGAMDGKTNNTGSFTLASGGASSTTINDERIGYDSVILLIPTSIASSTRYFPYGQFQDNNDQSITSTTTAYPMTFATTDYSEGVSITSSSRLTVAYSGLYNLQFSSQFSNTDSQIQDINIWFRKNGTNIAASNSKFSITERHGSTDGGLIAALNFFVPLQKNEYIEIVWQASNISVSMQAIPASTSPTIPSTPSVIATLQHVSSNGYTTDTFCDPYVSAKSKGSAVFSHPANSISGRTYDYIVVG